MNTFHPQAPAQGQKELDELYGRYMAAANASGYDGENAPGNGDIASMAWERYRAACIYWTHKRVLVAKPAKRVVAIGDRYGITAYDAAVVKG